MPSNVAKDATLVLSLAGVDYACQVINADYQMAAPADSTPVPVACGGTVSEPGDPSNGAITGEVFKDVSATGITRVLATAALSGAELAYVYTETDGNGETMTWDGTCTVPAFAIAFTPDKLGRHPLSLNVTTSNLAPAN